MTLDINTLAKTVLVASRRGWFRRKPIFKSHAATSFAELRKLEGDIGVQLPDNLRKWLLKVGYGDIDDELSFRKEWLVSIESGQLKGSARFAQDILGNFYAFDTSGQIFYLSRAEPVFAAMSKGFAEFIQELVRRDYKLGDWVNTLETQKYDWL